MYVHELLSIAASQIKSSTPKLDAEILLAHALKKDRSFLYSHSDEYVEKKLMTQFEKLKERRISGEPIAYIVGHQDFWNIRVNVNKDTLIPRPETELLVEKCLGLVGKKENQIVADLGTGSGAVAIALAKEKQSWDVVATDISLHALVLARENAKENHVENIDFHQGDWCEALPAKTFDVIISNPPYIEANHTCLKQGDVRFEPKSALTSGVDGLDAIRIIAHQAKSFLKEGAYLLIEHGFNQQKAIIEILRQEGYKDNCGIVDLSKLDRVVIARW